MLLKMFLIFRNNKNYKLWRQKWINNGAKFPPSASHYLAECELPFWIECTDCKKWRCVPKETKVTESFIKSFKCSFSSQHESGNKKVAACAAPQCKVKLRSDVYLMFSVSSPLC